MVALTVTASNVIYQSGPIDDDAVAGEAFAAGDVLYWNASDKKYYKAQCDGTAIEAGRDGIGLALFTADVAGARGSVALPGAVVAIGTGTAGIFYCPGTTTGDLIPTADLGSTNKATLVAVGIGSNQIKLAHVYDAGAVIG